MPSGSLHLPSRLGLYLHGAHPVSSPGHERPTLPAPPHRTHSAHPRPQTPVPPKGALPGWHVAAPRRHGRTAPSSPVTLPGPGWACTTSFHRPGTHWAPTADMHWDSGATCHTSGCSRDPRTNGRIRHCLGPAALVWPGCREAMTQKEPADAQPCPLCPDLRPPAPSVSFQAEPQEKQGQAARRPDATLQPQALLWLGQGPACRHTLSASSPGLGDRSPVTLGPQQGCSLDTPPPPSLVSSLFHRGGNGGCEPPGAGAE